MIHRGLGDGGGGSANEWLRDQVAANRGGSQPSSGGSSKKKSSSGTGGSRPSSDRVYLKTNNPGLRSYGTGGSRPASDRPGMGGKSTGGTRPLADRPGFLGSASSLAEDVYGDKDEVQESFYDWSDAEMQQWAAYCVSLGILSEEKASDPEALYAAWKDAVGHAATFAGKGRKVDPFQAAAWMASTDNWGRTENG